jgi:hypothetical protein
LLRRNVEDPEELAYYVVFAPKESTTLEELVRVAGTRWRIESCFEQAKDGFGLGEYEVRKWDGWHRHLTLCLLQEAAPLIPFGDPRAMEKVSQDLGRLLAEKEFGSIEEANAFLENMLREGGGRLPEALRLPPL